MEKENKPPLALTRRRFGELVTSVAALAAVGPSHILKAFPAAVSVFNPKESILQILGLDGYLSGASDAALPEAITQWKGFQGLFSIGASSDTFHHFVKQGVFSDKALATEFHSLAWDIGISPLNTQKALETPEALHAVMSEAAKHYSNGHRQFLNIRQAVQANPRLFNNAAEDLVREYPSLFTMKSKGIEQIDLPELWQRLKDIKQGDLPHCTPDQVNSWAWESYGRLTGRVPPEASPEVRAEIERVIAQPGYRPFISREAFLERAQQETEALALTVRRKKEDLPLMLIGQYQAPETARSAEVYILHDAAHTLAPRDDFNMLPAQTVLQKLATAINHSYPLEPISTVFVHADHHRAEMRGDQLRLIDPPPALKNWLDQLGQRKPNRVEAVQRISSGPQR